MRKISLAILTGLAALALAVHGEPLTAAAFMTGDGAALERVPCIVGSVGKGIPIFTDRDYTFHEPPAGLLGMTFLRLSMDGGKPLTVAKDGLLTVITPAPDIPGAFCSNAPQLEELGFTWIQAPPTFQLFGERKTDQCRIYQKQAKAGETFTFKKWVVVAGFNPEGQSFFRPNARVARAVEAIKRGDHPDAIVNAQDILINRPDYVVFVPKQPRDKDKRDNAKPGDTYNDHFQVIERDGVFYAFWTQATREADTDQHIAFSKSADKGETWTEPQLIAGSPNKKNPALLASWQQPMFSASGRLYVLWNQQTTSRGPHCGQMIGCFSEDGGDSWSAPKMVPMQRMTRDPADPLIPPSWCNWQRPLRLGKDGKYLVGVSRHGKLPGAERGECTVEFLQFDNIDDNPKVEDIRLSWFATDDNVLRVTHEKFGSACEEAGIVKLPDGRLFALTRTCAGYPFWSQSRDDGVTWSEPKKLLDRDGGTAYLHPRSPCPIYDWKGNEAASGMYFALIHNTFDFGGAREYQKRGPLYLIAGRFNADAEQPIEFAPMKLFAERENGNSFYTSYTVSDGKGILWFPDHKFFLLGREIGEEWFK